MNIFFPHADSFTVIADSHHNTLMLEELIPEAAKTGGIILLGDNCTDEKYILKRLFIPVYALSGNCDFAPGYPSEIQGTLSTASGPEFFACHGHRYNVKYSLARLLYRAQELNIGTVLFGHTHIPLKTEIDGITLINPGALKDGYYAVGHIKKKEVWYEMKRL